MAVPTWKWELGELCAPHLTALGLWQDLTSLSSLKGTWRGAKTALNLEGPPSITEHWLQLPRNLEGSSAAPVGHANHDAGHYSYKTPPPSPMLTCLFISQGALAMLPHPHHSMP